MVATLILVRNDNGDLHDQEGHLRNAARQRIDAQGAVIFEPNTDATGAAQPVDEAARPRTLADYNRPDQFYANRSAIRPPAIQRGNFEFKPYYTLVGQTPYCGLAHEHPMDHLERFRDLISAIKVNGIPGTTYPARSSSTHLLGRLHTGLSSCHQDDTTQVTLRSDLYSLK